MSSGLIIDNETIRTVIWAVVMVFAIYGVSIYTLVRLMVTGRPMFERKGEESPRGVVAAMRQRAE